MYTTPVQELGLATHSSLLMCNEECAAQARPLCAAGAHEVYIGPDGSIHIVNEACMYVLIVEYASVWHVVVLSLNSGGEGAEPNFVPRKGARSRARARRAGQA